MLFPATIEFRPNFKAVEALYHDLKVSEFYCPRIVVVLVNSKWHPVFWALRLVTKELVSCEIKSNDRETIAGDNSALLLGTK